MDSFLWFYDIAKCFFFLLCKKALSSLSFFSPKLDGGKPCFWIHRCVFVLFFGSITSLVLYCRPSIKLTRAALCRRTWVLFFELIILPLIFIFIFKLLLLLFFFFNFSFYFVLFCFFPLPVTHLYTFASFLPCSFSPFVYQMSADCGGSLYSTAGNFQN